MSLKKVLFAVFAVILLMGCQTEDGPNYDHQGRYDSEKVIIDEYLRDYAYDTQSDEIIKIENDEDLVPLIEDSNLVSYVKNFNGVNHTMYSYVTHVGAGDDMPDENDVINAGYRVHEMYRDLDTGTIGEGFTIDESYLNNSFYDLGSGTLYIGWSVGFQAFKEGDISEEDSTKPRQYTDIGKGFMIIPSGLTHAIEGNPVNNNLILVFKVELRSVTKIEN